MHRIKQIENELADQDVGNLSQAFEDPDDVMDLVGNVNTMRRIVAIKIYNGELTMTDYRKRVKKEIELSPQIRSLLEELANDYVDVGNGADGVISVRTINKVRAVLGWSLL